MFRELDPLLHSELRLAVVSLLVGVESADFSYLKEQTRATAGNLSVQLDKLSQAGYVAIEKTFRGKRPCTILRITGRAAKPSPGTWMPCGITSGKRMTLPNNKGQ